MKIGICSPFMSHDLVDLLDKESRQLLSGIKGVTATPVTPLARELLTMGHEICVFCLDPSVGDSFLLRGDRLSIHVLPKRRFRLAMMDFYGVERRLIAAAMASEKPDVISAQWSYEHALGALDTGIPTLVTCHDTPLRYAWIAKTFFMSYHVLVAAAVFRRAEHLNAVSPYTAQHIQRFFRPRSRVEVIPNGLPEDIFGLGQARFSEPPRLHPRFTLCSVGGWGGIKNIKSLLKAFAAIRSVRPDTRLVLFGRGLGSGEEAETWARNHSLLEGVEFRGSGNRMDILRFLSDSVDLMVHSSLIECHPMVLIEAIACGVPVIAGNRSGGVPWTLGEGLYGTLCDVRDPVAIAAAVNGMLADPQRMRASAEKAWQAIRDKFEIQKVASEMAKTLTRISTSP
jgi:L-malate glycosyltransferase